MQRAVTATHVARASHFQKVVAHCNVPAPRSHGHQQFDWLPHHLLLVVAEQIGHARVDHLNRAALIHHDQAVGCGFNNAAVPGFRGRDGLFLCFEFHGLTLEPDRLLLHGPGLTLCLLQQLIGPHAALQDFHIHGQHRHGAIEQGLFARPEALQRCHLQHTQQTVVAQNRQYRDRVRNSIPQAGADTHVIGRRPAQYQGRALHRALADQALTQIEILVQGFAIAQGIGAQHPKAPLVLFIHIKHAVADLYQRRQMGEQRLRKFCKTGHRLQCGRYLGQTTLDPGLGVYGLRTLLQHLNRARQRPGFIVVLRVRHLNRQITLCQLLHRAAKLLVGMAYGARNQPAYDASKKYPQT